MVSTGQAAAQALFLRIVPVFLVWRLRRNKKVRMVDLQPLPPALPCVWPPPAPGQELVFSRGVTIETPGDSTSEGFSQRAATVGSWVSSWGKSPGLFP